MHGLKTSQDYTSWKFTSMCQKVCETEAYCQTEMHWLNLEHAGHTTFPLVACHEFRAISRAASHLILLPLTPRASPLKAGSRRPCGFLLTKETRAATARIEQGTIIAFFGSNLRCMIYIYIYFLYEYKLYIR